VCVYVCVCDLCVFIFVFVGMLYDGFAVTSLLICFCRLTPSHIMCWCACVCLCVYACVYVCVRAHVVFELVLYCTMAGSGCAFLVLCVFVCV